MMNINGKKWVPFAMGMALVCGLLLGIASWPRLQLPTQYDEPAHRAFVQYLAHHPVADTIITYKGSQNYEAKGPAFFLLAALFGRIFGFELEHLRILTLLFSLAAVWGFALLCRLMPQCPSWSPGLLLCLPYYLVLSLTFMTDIPSLALLLFGLHGYLSFLKNHQTWQAITGIICVTLVAYIRVDYIYILGGIGLGCLMCFRLNPRILLLLMVPIVLRIPLVMVWGGLAAPPAQTRGHAVGLGFNPQYLIFSLALVGFYFWPLLIEKLKLDRRQTLFLMLLSAVAVVPASLFFAPQISPDNVDQYAGTLRSLMLALKLSHAAQWFSWTLLAALGGGICILFYRLNQAGDVVVSCVKASCLAGLLIQLCRGQVIYERYFLEVSPLLLLLFAGAVTKRGVWWCWVVWSLGLQLVQLARHKIGAA